MSSRLLGTRKMCPAGYKKGNLEALFVCHNDVFLLQMSHVGCANRLGKKYIYISVVQQVFEPFVHSFLLDSNGHFFVYSEHYCS